MVLIALAMAFILASSFLAAQGTTIQVARSVHDHARATQLAETALRLGVARIERDAAWRDSLGTGAWITDETWESGTFSLTVADGDALNPDAEDRVTLTAVGALGSATARATAVMWPRPGGGDEDDDGSGVEAGFGVMTTESIRLDGSARIDSYDASLGPYGGSNRSNEAVVGTSGTANSIVRLTGSASIGGDVWIGPDADPSQAVDTPGWANPISGSISNLAQTASFSPPDHGIDQPLTRSGIPNWGSITFGQTGAATEYRWEELRTGGSTTVIFRGEVRILVEGDVQFGGGSRIQINDGSLELFVKGSFRSEGSVPVNAPGASGDPGNLTIYMLNGGDVAIRGSSEVHGAIFGPGSDAAIQGSAELFGGFHGKSLTLSGSAKLHQDLNHPMTSLAGADDDEQDEQGPGGYAVVWR